MALIPDEWREDFGGPALTGNCCLSIISASSSGPSVSVFDPGDVGIKNPLPGKTLLFYPLGNPLAPIETQNETFNLTTKITGVAFPSGSNSVLFFGHQGIGPYCYGEGSTCNDPCDASKGTHAYPYRPQVWAYDARELLQVKEGSKQPWEIRPYSVWPIEGMGGGDCTKISGADFDSKTGKLYITPVFADNPIVHVLQITTTNSTTLIESDRKGKPSGSSLGVSSKPSAGEIRFEAHLPKIRDAKIICKIRDLQGTLLGEFPLNATSPGVFTSTWNGIGKVGRVLPGIYFASVSMGRKWILAQKFNLDF
jgi:hypothetical protein